MPIGLPLPVPDVSYGWPDCIGRSQRTLPRLQLILYHMTVKFQKCHTASGKLLHDKSLSAENSGTDPLLEEDRQIHAGFRCQKTGLLYYDFSPGRNLMRNDLSRKTGCKRDHSVTALCSIRVLENRLSGKHPSECFADPAVGTRLHLHIRGHPAHGSLLCDHRFSFF